MESNPQPEGAKETWPVNLLRQMLFCPRIPWFREVLGLAAPSQPWMRQGERFQEVMEQRLERRVLARFGLDDAAWHKRPFLRSPALGLHGIADLALVGTDRVAVVEIKLGSGGVRRGERLQLAAYGLMAEAHFALPCREVFLLFGERGFERITLGDALRKEVRAAAGRLCAIMAAQRVPDSPATAAQCTQCEHLNACNDRF